MTSPHSRKVSGKSASGASNFFSSFLQKLAKKIDLTGQNGQAQEELGGKKVLYLLQVTRVTSISASSASSGTPEHTHTKTQALTCWVL